MIRMFPFPKTWAFATFVSVAHAQPVILQLRAGIWAAARKTRRGLGFITTSKTEWW